LEKEKGNLAPIGLFHKY